MNTFISYVGFVVTVAGALSLMALIAGIAMNYGWRKFNDWLTYADNSYTKGFREGKQYAELNR